MGVEQGIYTSCLTGIEKNTSGFQLYSYSDGMKNLLQETEVGRMFQYEAPGGEVDSQFPQKYAYRIVDEKRNLAAFAMNSSAVNEGVSPGGRQGNFYSHVLVTSLGEVKVHPCRYYQSPLFKDQLDWKEFAWGEAYGKGKPRLLSKLPSMLEGTQNVFEKIRSFLMEQNRIQVLKQMIQCTLSYNSGEWKKPLVICDESKNIIHWIRAITLVLPIKNAKDISFSTYEFDPYGSGYRICGVSKEGTKYDWKDQENLNQVYLFDFCHGVYPEVVIDSTFFEFVEKGYLVSLEYIQHFHEFMKMTSYTVADKKILSAYELYRIWTGESVFCQLRKEEQEKVLEFLEDFAYQEVREQVIQIVIDTLLTSQQMEQGSLGRILHFLSEHWNTTFGTREKYLKGLLNQLFRVLRGEGQQKERFDEYYQEMKLFFFHQHYSLANELIFDATQMETRKQELLDLIYHTKEVWRYEAIYGLLIEQMRDKQITSDCLQTEGIHRKLLEAIMIRAATSRMERTSVIMGMAKQFYHSFENDVRYWIRFTCLLEETLNNRLGIYILPSMVWKEFYHRFDSLEKHQKYIGYKQLITDRKWNRLIMIFRYHYENGHHFLLWFEDMKEFLTHFQFIPEKEKEVFLRLCFEKAVEEEAKLYENCYAIFVYLKKNDKYEHYINHLIAVMSKAVPILSDFPEEKEKVTELFYYQLHHNNGKIENRIAMAYRLDQLKAIAKEKEVKMEFDSFAKPVRMETMDIKEVEEYLKEAGACIGKIIVMNLQISLLDKFFQMTEEQQEILVAQAVDEAVAYAKRTKEYLPFIKILVPFLKQDARYADNCVGILHKYRITRKEMEHACKRLGNSSVEQEEFNLCFRELERRNAFVKRTWRDKLRIFGNKREISEGTSI